MLRWTWSDPRKLARVDPSLRLEMWSLAVRDTRSGRVRVAVGSDAGIPVVELAELGRPRRPTASWSMQLRRVATFVL